MNDDLLYDKRLVDRHVRAGRLDQEALDKHIADLPDLADVAATVSSEISSVGLENRDAEDTGETDV